MCRYADNPCGYNTVMDDLNEQVDQMRAEFYADPTADGLKAFLCALAEREIARDMMEGDAEA